MAVKAAVHHHRAFEIDEVAGLKISEIGSLEGLAYRRDFVSTVGVECNDCKTHAVVGDGLVDAELVGKRTFYSEVNVAFVMGDGGYGRRFFYNS